MARGYVDQIGCSGLVDQEAPSVRPFSAMTSASAPPTRRQHGEGHLFVFEAGQLVLGMPAQNVRGLEDGRSPVPLPGCPPYVLGVRKYQGRMLPVVDLSIFLDSKAKGRTDRRSRRTMVISEREVELGILCDQIHTMVETEPDQWRTPLLFKQPQIEPLLQGEVHVDDRWIGVLDLPALIRASRVK